MKSESSLRLSGWSCVVGGTALIAQTLLPASLPEGCVGSGCARDLRGTAAGDGPLLVRPGLVVTTGILVAVLVLRARLIPTWLAVGMVASASLLLLENGQTALVLLAVPFSTMCVVLGLNLIADARHVVDNQRTPSASLRRTP